jgi:hypothetical protein
MPCTFAGVFFLAQIRNRILDCCFVDESNSIQAVNMTYFAPSPLTDEPSPFWEPNAMDVQRVYFITGVMGIENANYVNPVVYSPESFINIINIGVLSFKFIMHMSFITIL